jgi:hypothetical protein
MSTIRNRAFLSAAAAILVGVALAPEHARAAVCIGACGTLGANGNVGAPPGGGTYGWISTAGGLNGVGQLPGVGPGATNGSTFTTSAFSATAGQVLQYYFNFVSSDGQAQAGQFIYEDYAYVELLNGSGVPVAMLFNGRAEPTGLIVPGSGLPPISPGVTLVPPTSGMTLGSGTQGNMAGGPVWSPLASFSGWCWGPGCGYTGWIKSNYTIPNSGTYKLQFGVTNWGDTIYDTGLAFNGITVGGGPPIGEGVPEPATWAAMLIGLGALGALARTRRSRAAA